uniref:Chromosome 1 open reading frame 194 n=1 Tax=Varanus komodoensis TaxID=61221 RepID=A0A8D2J2B1_VARKO
MAKGDLKRFIGTALRFLRFSLLQKAPYAVPTHLAQQRDPWNRLHGSRDSLDFNLSSLYNHHEDLLKDKSKVPLKKRTAPPVHCPTSRGISVRHWVNPIKESIHSIEGAIESPHTAATNSGYSRKENGGIFYH